MAWSIRFDYDLKHDVVHASFSDCVLETVEDVLRWRREVECWLSQYPTRVDLLINLDGLMVRTSAGRAFGRERREVLERYTARSFRYGGDELTTLFVATSGAINGAPVNHYPSREAALAALLADRETARQRGFNPFSGVPLPGREDPLLPERS